MRYGIILPGGTATEQLELGVLAESAGWDGVFVWEASYGVDAWSVLAAIAARTGRVHLGTMLTPLPWRRPWKVASQAATLEQLAQGRVILTLGLGALTEDLPRVGEEEGLSERAATLDEGIDLMHALWQCHASFDGTALHYSFEMDDQLHLMRPSSGRIPTWVVVAWPRPKSMRRALRCDGVVPQFERHEDSPDLARDVRQWLDANGATSHDLIAQGETSTTDRLHAADEVARWATAGCTWWLETNWEMPHHGPQRFHEVRRRLEAGPPTGQ